jgi:hypothetical protein
MSFEFEQLGETEFEKKLSYEAAAQMGSIDEKKTEDEDLTYCPFKTSTTGPTR